MIERINSAVLIARKLYQKSRKMYTLYRSVVTGRRPPLPTCVTGTSGPRTFPAASRHGLIHQLTVARHSYAIEVSAIITAPTGTQRRLVRPDGDARVYPTDYPPEHVTRIKAWESRGFRQGNWMGREFLKEATGLGDQEIVVQGAGRSAVFPVPAPILPSCMKERDGLRHA